MSFGYRLQAAQFNDGGEKVANEVGAAIEQKHQCRGHEVTDEAFVVVCAAAGFGSIAAAVPTGAPRYSMMEQPRIS